MVARLPLPEHDSIAIAESVIDERVHHRDFFDSLKEDWISQILNYRESGGNPCVVNSLNLETYISQQRIDEERGKPPRLRESHDPLTRLTQRRKNSLIGLYQPDEGKDLHRILELMRDKHKLPFCPCCGEPGKPGTLDHYLPKSKYPEFSIVVENLTPMCSDCQGLKGNDVRDELGNKVYIHPYYDPIEQVLIELEIRPPYENPSAFIASVPNGTPEPLKSLIQRHIKEIDFVSRFEEYCSNEYSDLLSMLAEEQEDEDREPVQKTIGRFLAKARKQAENRWEAIFYRGVLSNQHLLHYFEHSDLSVHLKDVE
ncbi:HNH endonuclease [Vibrio nigripulchritudo]|uniref:Putative Restriction endonuclease n=1 Tax=Vibrio nigripulchritudo TaxID=28173 RepID=U4K2C6_9VIBR|nr:restriction endonuclease [Vibrio nigripulchritudo]CCN81197.1 putative Restriction endonuclease [Vibrio nigripulchritudo BLFn1]CCN88719.1 putative Restriction endonuclease [Vibrio nigripulchritudo SFn27]CCN94636.1 putative Restriction endonuclease [Vibrio nigripulchritudo ENn2]CCO53567.1 putative Restriction endonuclease [Vibrio nigripulchritudo Wn13]CCO58107.1 putative Restriction endonuclease [Vibrio nigripulchritudo]